MQEGGGATVPVSIPGSRVNSKQDSVPPYRHKRQIARHRRLKSKGIISAQNTTSDLGSRSSNGAAVRYSAAQASVYARHYGSTGTALPVVSRSIAPCAPDLTSRDMTTRPIRASPPSSASPVLSGSQLQLQASCVITVRARPLVSARRSRLAGKRRACVPQPNHRARAQPCSGIRPPCRPSRSALGRALCAHSVEESAS